mgnify:CR=1 FL=1
MPFQSHAGSIEARLLWSPPGGGFFGFNPTLVRLRRLEGGWRPALEDGFQSHAGSIEAN